MGTKDKMQRVGKKAYIQLAGLRIEVKIIDYKFSFGHDRWQVEPVAGSQTVWVENLHNIHD